MKQTLLLFFLLTTFSIAFSQNRFAEELDIEKTEVISDPSEIRIFPNPATSFIGLNQDSGVEQVVIFNLVGRRMKAFLTSENDNRYYVGDLPRGMYLVQLLGSKNEILTTKRVNKR